MLSALLDIGMKSSDEFGQGYRGISSPRSRQQMVVEHIDDDSAEAAKGGNQACNALPVDRVVIRERVDRAMTRHAVLKRFRQCSLRADRQDIGEHISDARLGRWLRQNKVREPIHRSAPKIAPVAACVYFKLAMRFA